MSMLTGKGQFNLSENIGNSSGSKQQFNKSECGYKCFAYSLTNFLTTDLLRQLPRKIRVIPTKI